MSVPIPTWIKATAGVLALGAVGGGAYYFGQSKPATVSTAATSPINAAADPDPAPTIKYPIAPVVTQPAEVDSTPLPDLQDSDASAIAALITLFDDATVATLLKPEFLIPRMVATIDNLPRQRLNSHALPIKRVPGDFIIAASGDEVFIAETNSARYDLYVNAFVVADNAQMLALYRRWYPLFQQAYRELGDPNAYFNNRLVEVIDHMLDAPDAAPPVPVLKPRSMWEYADPNLQSASIGHRLLFRLGPAHAAQVKAKLVELRAGVTALEATPQ